MPFSTSGPIDGWSPAVFAESLAVCLNANPAVDARVGRDAADQADFALDGEVSMKDGHAVIALRLIPTGQRAASWSATFWRDNLGDSALAADLAGRVTEALGLANTTVDTPTAKTTPNTKAKEHLP